MKILCTVKNIEEIHLVADDTMDRCFDDSANKKLSASQRNDGLHFLRASGVLTKTVPPSLTPISGSFDHPINKDILTELEKMDKECDIDDILNFRCVAEQEWQVLRALNGLSSFKARLLSKTEFQILRDLMPNSDQKRDKASFLLEVIEYIRFLHEKVQKYESYPDIPWNNTQSPRDGPAAPGYMFSGNDNNISVPPVLLSNMQHPRESEVSLQPNMYASVGRTAGFTQPQHRLVYDSNNIASQSR